MEINYILSEIILRNLSLRYSNDNNNNNCNNNNNNIRPYPFSLLVKKNHET